MRGIIPKHLQARFNALDKLQARKNLPAPWQEPVFFAIGGLTCAGFAENSDLLLTVSHDGRGVLDCHEGSMIARDDSNEFNFDFGNLKVEGIGPLAGQKVHMSGLYGGGLACQTTDGWSIERHPLSWPDDELFLSPPGQTLLGSHADQPVDVSKLANFSSEIRAFGFSPTGRSLIIATAADISLFRR